MLFASAKTPKLIIFITQKLSTKSLFYSCASTIATFLCFWCCETGKLQLSWRFSCGKLPIGSTNVLFMNKFKWFPHTLATFPALFCSKRNFLLQLERLWNDESSRFMNEWLFHWKKCFHNVVAASCGKTFPPRIACLYSIISSLK